MYDPEIIRTFQMFTQYVDKYNNKLDSAFYELREHKDEDGDVFQVSPKVGLFFKY